MAVVFQDEDKDKTNEEGGTTLGTESAVINPTEAPPASANSASGQYTNLQAYLDANKGNNQAQNLAGKVNTEVDEAANAQKQSEQSFKGLVDQNTVKEDLGLYDKIKQDPTALGQEDKDTFTKMRTAQYRGPKNLADDFSDYVNAQKENSEAQQAGQATQSESGRMALLKRFYGRPDYTQGQQKLDQLLVQNDEGADSAFSAAKQRADKQSASFGNLKDSLNQYAQQAAETTGNTAKNASNFIGQQEQGLEDNLKSNYQNEISRRDKEYNDINQALASGQITQSQAKKLRLDASQGAVKLYGQNPLSYLSKSATPTLSEFTSKGDAAKYQALADLAGQQNTLLTSPEQFGTYDPNKAVGFDTNRFQNDVTGNQARFNEAMNRKIIGGGAQNIAERDADLGGEWGLTTGSLQDNLNWLQTPQGQEAMSGLNAPLGKGVVQAREKVLMDTYNKLKAKYGADTALKIING
jgi:hypothetical protein